MELSISQIERLCAAVYLDALITDGGKHSLAYIMDYILEEGFEKEEPPALMTRTQWETVAKSIRDDIKLKDFIITDYMNGEQTGRAVCFMNEKNPRELYVVFRGTSGDEEWYDNGLGMLVSDTPAQKSALDFLLKVSESPELGFICVAGHSKGGNKAQYCAILGTGIVDVCVSVDGQGFSRLFFDKYSGIIEKRKARIISVAERRDFVNCLGFCLKEPDFYSGGRGDKSREFPYGEPLPYFHCPDALRLKTGDIGPIAPVSYISRVINTFTLYFLTDDKYEKKRGETVLGLTSLMYRDGGGEKGARAVAEAALAFFELAEESPQFRAELADLLLYEKDVVIATTLMIKQNHRKSGVISDMIMMYTAENLLRHPAYFLSFIKCAERFAVYRRKAKTIGEQAEHVNHFLKGISRHIEHKKI
ncbi:MAG: DUF2974 domain-containing protein [Oscillospiraceae bacterium]|nr:DUF2974 domain-containing protein [Oscillospiraceae bacterium]